MKSQSRSEIAASLLLLNEDDSTLPQYTSFILRCRTIGDGRVRLRLTEVRSGLSCIVTDLNDLPDALWRWMSPVQEHN